MIAGNAGRDMGKQSHSGRNRALGWWIAGAAATLVISVVAAQMIARADVPQVLPAVTSTPSASATAPSSPEPTAVPGVTSAAAIQQPASCDALYTPALLAEFGELALNPEWSKAPGGTLYGTDDQQLQGIIAAREPLQCHWGSEKGGSGVGLSTDVVSVEPEVSALVEARLKAVGATCYDELSGLRCVTSGSGDGDLWGESHFLRDDLWLATKYVNFVPENYTETIVANLWGEQ